MRVVLNIVAALLLLALSAQAKPRDIAPLETGPEINEYIDRLVNEIKKLIIVNGMDPMPLPNLISDFEYIDIFGIRWHGNASLTEGSLEGILTILREGDVDMSYGSFLLHVGGRLNFGMLRMVYDFEASVMDLGPVGQAVCTITDTKMDFQYDMDLSTLQSNITYFEVSSVGRTKCEIRDVGIIYDILMETLINLFIDIFENTILGILSDLIQTYMQMALDIIGGFTPAPVIAYTVPVSAIPLLP